jgi:hypothetical protein
MEIWDFQPYARLLNDKMHGFRQRLHARPEVLAVLASNVAG